MKNIRLSTRQIWDAKYEFTEVLFLLCTSPRLYVCSLKVCNSISYMEISLNEVEQMGDAE